MLAWAQKHQGSAGGGLTFAVCRRGDAIEVTLTLRGQLTRLMLANPTGAHFVGAHVPVRMEAQLTVPAGGGPVVCEQAMMRVKVSI